jgi:coiled-coil domain-containing protein 77
LKESISGGNYPREKMQDSGASAMQAALPHTHDARTGTAKHVHIAAECPYTGNHIEMLPPTSELTEHYRSRCEGFQRLEEDYIARLETLQLSVEERHQARWQFLRAQGEVEDLQEALSDAKVAYFDERERAIALAGENDALKLQEVEDRNRIQQLLALSQPVTDEVIILRDRGHLPVKAPLPIEGPGGGMLSDVTRSKLALAQQQQVRQPAQSSSLIINSGAFVRGVSANAMSNKILLPEGASIEGLVFELQSLRLQAEENKRLWREKEEVLLEDRRVKVHEARAMRERHAAQLEALEAKVRTLEADLCAATKDYLLVRHTSAKQVAEAREAEALARHNAQELFARFQEYSSKTAAEVQGAAQAVRRRDADAMQAHLAQAQHADAEVLRLQTQLAAEAIASRQREEALVSKLEQQHRRNTQARCTSLDPPTNCRLA